MGLPFCGVDLKGLGKSRPKELFDLLDQIVDLLETKKFEKKGNYFYFLNTLILCLIKSCSFKREYIRFRWPQNTHLCPKIGEKP